MSFIVGREFAIVLAGPGAETIPPSRILLWKTRPHNSATRLIFDQLKEQRIIYNIGYRPDVLDLH